MSNYLSTVKHVFPGFGSYSINELKTGISVNLVVEINSKRLMDVEAKLSDLLIHTLPVKKLVKQNQELFKKIQELQLQIDDLSRYKIYYEMRKDICKGTR